MMLARAVALIAARILGAFLAALAIGIDSWKALAIAALTGSLPTAERLLRVYARTGQLTAADLEDKP